jgi:catalase
VPDVRTRMVAMLAHVDETLAQRVATGLGLSVPTKLDKPLNMSVPADGEVERFQPKPVKKPVGHSPALSMAATMKDSIKTRRVAILAADGVDEAALSHMKQALSAAGAQAKVVAPRLGTLKSANGAEVSIDFSLLTAGSVLFDAVYVPGGEKSVEMLKGEGKALHFIHEAYKHCKAIAATGAGAELLNASYLGAQVIPELSADGNQMIADDGVIISRDTRVDAVAEEFMKAIAQHRHWSRELKDQVPA